MRRRRPFSLPDAEQVPTLCRALDPAAELGVPADPARLADAAERHNVLVHLLTAADEGRLELHERVLQRARKLAAGRAVQARLLRRALPGLVAVIERGCGVEPLLIKGPAVADRIYPEPVLRPFVDLDLLVPQEALRDAARALAGEGFEISGEFRPGYAECWGHDLHATRPGPPRLHLDLHWRVGDDPSVGALDHAFAAHGAERLELEGGSVLVPRPPRQLLILAVHLLRDPNKQLAWVNDIALAAGSMSDEEWDEAFADASRARLAWVLHRALDYAHWHLGYARSRPVPAGEPPPWGPLRAIEEIDAPAARHLGWLAALSWSERARYLRYVLLPSREGLAARSGADGAPIPRQLARHGARAVRGLRATRESRRPRAGGRPAQRG